jgi:hypothetical protein
MASPLLGRMIPYLARPLMVSVLVASVATLVASRPASGTPTTVPGANPVQAAPASCVKGEFRGYDFPGSTAANMDGVNSQLWITDPADLGNYTAYPPGGDIYVSGSGTGTNMDFFQFGWVTHANDTVIGWTGEQIPGQTHETLTNLSLTFSVNAAHNFRILRTSSGYYDYYADSVLIGQSKWTHPPEEAAVNGEQDNSCGWMYNVAERNPSPPCGTLYYHTASQGWVAWTGDRRGVQPIGNTEYESDGLCSEVAGTDFAYGGP